ncbi:CinA family protein [Trueperella bialowiezensis]|uniref:Competence damage-inducible protein A n=1 Tax=Trueperella bialowiezensis TaxID=312285 RepID=A0A448PCB6_9ACTO|nr:nicotinamide-nucleotide amidohydrolase family protein [Trueperella bialowiezensis]VEI12630.1 competence damage-inducible protein A [Trueperella bialowiezensis]
MSEHDTAGPIGDAGSLAHDVVTALTERGGTIAVAESLTGGLLASTIVSVPGASECFRGGAVTYATDTKASVLGVSRERLAQTGPVDGVVAQQMATGVAELFGADIGIATTGVAGPGPADGHPAGTVYVAIATRRLVGAAGDGVVHADSGMRAKHFHFDGNRAQVRQQAVDQALNLVNELLKNFP